MKFSGKYLRNHMVLALMELLPDLVDGVDRSVASGIAIASRHSMDMKFTHIDAG